MARVTVEDCVDKVPNRFDLVMFASQRSRDIANGASIEVDRDNDKNPVVALREIADEKLNHESLGDSLVRGLQKYIDTDEPEEEDELEAFAQSLLGGEPTTGMGEGASEDAGGAEMPEGVQMPSFDDAEIGRDD